MTTLKLVPFRARPKVPPEQTIQQAKTFFKEISSRRTVRDFADIPVPKETIEWAIRAAGSAPSGANKQPWTFVAISNSQIKTKIREAAEKEEAIFYAGKAGKQWLNDLAHLGTDEHKPFLETAPWLIVVFQQNYGLDEETGERSKHYYIQESVGLASGLLIAALHLAGLTTLTHTPSPMGFLRDLLGRPKSERAVMIVVAGYPAADAMIPDISRKTLGEISEFIEEISEFIE
ncbi:MAG: nitroreductase family protein [Robiginitomaculum sp.]|nr:MAG: nitroreductase family protein [Robiginitomaculum sp.]